jgi:nucleoside-diphosphate-sugar epimerase
MTVVFVTGASGFIGSAFVERLVRERHEVRGLVRSENAATALERRGGIAVRGGLDDLKILRREAERSDAVVHLAYAHGASEAEALDVTAIPVLGDALGATGRPLLVTSGTLVLPSGQIGREGDPADDNAFAAPRGRAERRTLELAEQGVTAGIVRLAPSVHDGVRRGFAGALVDTAIRSGVAAVVGNGDQRWPAVHRGDVVDLYVSALAKLRPGMMLHGVGEEGVRMRDVAELIASRLQIPRASIAESGAREHFGWVGPLVATDVPASSEATRAILGWEPKRPGLIADMTTGRFFEELR